jgi:hypothetical protein
MILVTPVNAMINERGSLRSTRATGKSLWQLPLGGRIYFHMIARFPIVQLLLLDDFEKEWKAWVLKLRFNAR